MNSRKLEGTEEVRPPRLTTNGKGLGLQSRGSGPLLFPERFVQSAAPLHLVHVRGTHRGVGILPSAGPSLCVIAPVLMPQDLPDTPLRYLQITLGESTAPRSGTPCIGPATSGIPRGAERGGFEPPTPELLTKRSSSSTS